MTSGRRSLTAGADMAGGGKPRPYGPSKTEP